MIRQRSTDQEAMVSRKVKFLSIKAKFQVIYAHFSFRSAVLLVSIGSAWRSIINDNLSYTLSHNDVFDIQFLENRCVHFKLLHKRYNLTFSDLSLVGFNLYRSFKEFQNCQLFLIVAILITIRHQSGVICQLQIHILDDESDECYIQKVVYYILYVTYCMWQSII